LNFEQFQAAVESILAAIRTVMIGQEDAIRYSLIVILTNQHALIEGVPGLGKTLLARTLAAVLGCEFKRIQFTPDLMPADITGTNVFNLQRNEFTLVKGPLFTTFLLADEINRAPAKTQSALLEAMQERTVTIDRESYRLSPGFTVFATQNPIESEAGQFCGVCDAEPHRVRGHLPAARSAEGPLHAQDSNGLAGNR
jgi:MoxR-like ATPase